jgi:hypothetical protein
LKTEYEEQEAITETIPTTAMPRIRFLVIDHSFKNILKRLFQIM